MPMDGESRLLLSVKCGGIYFKLCPITFVCYFALGALVRILAKQGSGDTIPLDPIAKYSVTMAKPALH